MRLMMMRPLVAPAGSDKPAAEEASPRPPAVVSAEGRAAHLKHAAELLMWVASVDFVGISLVALLLLMDAIQIYISEFYLGAEDSTCWFFCIAGPVLQVLLVGNIALVFVIGYQMRKAARLVPGMRLEGTVAQAIFFGALPAGVISAFAIGYAYHHHSFGYDHTRAYGLSIILSLTMTLSYLQAATFIFFRRTSEGIAQLTLLVPLASYVLYLGGVFILVDFFDEIQDTVGDFSFILILILSLCSLPVLITSFAASAGALKSIRDEIGADPTSVLSQLSQWDE